MSGSRRRSIEAFVAAFVRGLVETPRASRQSRRSHREGRKVPASGRDADLETPASARDARLGESIAAAHLEALGYEIVARNLRLGRDEADLVAVVPAERKDDPPIVAIVEVKTSRGLAAPPHLRIDAGKRRRLIRLAEGLLAHDELAEAFIRFDAVGVHLGFDPPRVDHLPACFEARSPTDRCRRRREFERREE